MSILEKILGRDVPPRTTPPKPDLPMQRVLDHLARLGGKPIETLSPQEARLQPTPTDAAKAILEETLKDQDPTLGIQTRDITIDGAAGPLQARVYSPNLDSDGLKPLVVRKADLPFHADPAGGSAGPGDEAGRRAVVAGRRPAVDAQDGVIGPCRRRVRPPAIPSSASSDQVSPLWP